jgi:hypothetical protein
VQNTSPLSSSSRNWELIKYGADDGTGTIVAGNPNNF